MSMKAISGLLVAVLFAVTYAWAQDSSSSSDIIAQLKTQLDLQNDQVNNITPIIDKYEGAFHDLQKSIEDGTINPSAVESQRQGIEAAETQELSQYLKPYQLSEWRDIQSQMDQKDKGNRDADADQAEYSNLPNNTPSQ